MAFHPACSSGLLDRGWHETRIPCIHMVFGGTETAPTSTCCLPATPPSTLRSCSGNGSFACWKVKLSLRDALEGLSMAEGVRWERVFVERLSGAGMRRGAV